MHKACFFLAIFLYFVLTNPAMAYSVSYLSANQVDSTISEYSDCGVNLNTYSTIDSLNKEVWSTSPSESFISGVDILVTFTHEESSQFSGSAGGRLFRSVMPDDTVTVLLKDSTTPYTFDLLCKIAGSNSSSIEEAVYYSEFANGYVIIPFAQIEGESSVFYSLELLLRDGKLVLFDFNVADKPDEQPVLATYSPTTNILNIPSVRVHGQTYAVDLRLEDGFVFSIEDIQLTADIASGLIADYPFNGNARDVSGNGNHGVVSGATLANDRFDNSNKAYAFDGVSNFISFPEDIFTSSVSEYSISLWVSTEDKDYRDQQVIFYKGTISGESLIDVYSNQFRFAVKLSNGNWYTATHDLTRNQYQHITAVYRKGTGIELWVNGVLENAVPIENLDLYVNTIHPSSIGAFAQNRYESTHWDNKIDDIKIYNRALSGLDISGLFQSSSQ